MTDSTRRPTPSASPAPNPDAPASLVALRARYLEAQLRGDRREALRLVEQDGLAAGHTVPALHLHVITPAQREIGRLWQENRIDVAREHAATAVSQLVVAHLYRHLPMAERLGRRVLVACAPGERHEMGARIASDFLESSGFDVDYLGPDVPAEALAAQARALAPDLVVLSAATGLCTPGLVDAVRAVRAARGPEFPVLVGGAAFHDAELSPACDLPADVLQHGLDAPGLVALACERLGLVPASAIQTMEAA